MKAPFEVLLFAIYGPYGGIKANINGENRKKEKLR